MKILDSHNKNNWESQGVSFVSKSIIMNANSKLRIKLSKFNSVNIKIIGKKISGNGFLKLYIKNSNGEIFFSKDLKFTKNSWTEQSLVCNIEAKNGILELMRSKNSFGRIEISRIVLDDGISRLIPEKKSSLKDVENFNLYLKNLISLRTKIAVIIPYGIYGGGEVYLKNIFSKVKDVFNVDFLYLSKNKLEYEISNSKINHKHVKNLNRMASTLVNNKYDTVIFYNSRKVYDVIKDLKKENKINSKVIEIYHSDFLWQDAVAALRVREGVDLIYRVSSGLAVDISGILDENKSLIPVGIDTKAFIRKDDRNLRRELRIPDQKTVFGMVARLSPEKNIEYAINLIKDFPDIQLLIIGSGPLALRLQSFVEANNVNNVIFLGYKRNIQDFYNIFDAFLLTSKIEGTPISILEAMSCCLPVYSTGVGQIENNFGDLDNFHILSGSMNLDKDIIKGQIGASNYYQNLREYILNNHDIDVISNDFFANIINSSLSCKEKDEDSKNIYGEYI